MKALLSIHAMALMLLLSACRTDPEHELQQAFARSDRIEMNMLYDGQEVAGVKFGYRSEQQRKQLEQGIGPAVSGKVSCGEEQGHLNFWKGEDRIFRMYFLVTDGCRDIWFTKGITDYHFQLSDSLAYLMNSRYRLVRTIESAKSK